MRPRFRNKRHAGRALGFDSGLEADIAKSHPGILYEAIKIRYEIPASMHHYTPDFRLPNGVIVESKGLFSAQDRAKQLLVRQQWPALDIRFVFQRAKARVWPGVKMTCAEWAERHGFKYAEKTIPDSWLREAGPKVKPEDVLSVSARVS